MIPRDFIKQVVERTDVLKIIEPYVQMKKLGQDHVGLCPFHKEKTPSFTVSSKKQFYHCFGCGANGDAIGFLLGHVGLSFPEAIRQLATDAGMQIPDESEEMLAEAQRQRQQNHLLEHVAAYFRRELHTTPAAIAYVKQRGLTGETVACYGLGYAPAKGEKLGEAFPDAIRLLEQNGLLYPQSATGEISAFFRDRLMFPIRNARGQLVGFAGRMLRELADAGRKYQNSPESPLFQKRKELYGLAEALPAIKQDGYAIVVEGYMDVLMLHQHEINNVVAGMGTAFTTEQLASLYRHTSKIVFCFDGDSAGLRASRRALDTLLPELVEGKQASFVLLPKDEDPDTLVAKEKAEGFLARIEAGPSVLDFLFQQLALEHPGNGPEAKAAFVAAARESLSTVSSPLLRAAAAARLAEITHIDENILRSTLRRGAPAESPAKAQSLYQTLLRLAVFAPDAAQELTDIVLPSDIAETEALQAVLSWVRLHRPEDTEALLLLAAESPFAQKLTELAATRTEWPGDPASDLRKAALRYRDRNQPAGEQTRAARVAALKQRFAPPPPTTPPAPVLSGAPAIPVAASPTNSAD